MTRHFVNRDRAAFAASALFGQAWSAIAPVAIPCLAQLNSPFPMRLLAHCMR